MNNSTKYHHRPLSIGVGILAAFGLCWKSYRVGQQNPTGEAVYQREIERMGHPYTNPLAEICDQNDFYLKALDIRTSKLETAVDDTVLSLPDTNGSSAYAQEVRRLQTLIHEECDQYRQDIEALRDNNTRIDWRGESLPMATRDYNFVRPLPMVLHSYYLGSRKDLELLQREYDTRQALQNGEDIPLKGMKPLSPEKIDEIYNEWQEQHNKK